MNLRSACLASGMGLALAMGLSGVGAPLAGEDALEAEAPIETNRDILVMLRMPAQHYRPNARYSGSYDDAAAQAARKRTAATIARENGLELLESWPMPLVGVDCYVMRVPADRSLEDVIARVSRNRMVAWSQPLQTYETRAAVDNDPLFLTQPAASQWRLADLHQVATGRGVRIAVIDSKIDVAHPDLVGQFIVDRDFLGLAGPAEAHGTGIAGVIAARPGNGVGIVGIAPDARLMALRACSERHVPGRADTSTCDTLTLAKALHYAVEQGADVINMSLSGPPDPLLASLIRVGIERKIAFVASFDPNLPAGGFPASQPGVIPAAEESLPSLPGRVYRAPGRDVPTTLPGGRWNLVNGSSFAAAHVAGLVALLREERGASAAQIARSQDGAVDACATLVRVTSNCRCACAVARVASPGQD